MDEKKLQKFIGHFLNDLNEAKTNLSDHKTLGGLLATFNYIEHCIKEYAMELKLTNTWRKYEHGKK